MNALSPDWQIAWGQRARLDSACWLRRGIDRPPLAFRRDRNCAAGAQAALARGHDPAPAGAAEHVAREAVPERDGAALVVAQLEVGDSQVAVAGILRHDRKLAAALLDRPGKTRRVAGGRIEEHRDRVTQ